MFLENDVLMIFGKCDAFNAYSMKTVLRSQAGNYDLQYIMLYRVSSRFKISDVCLRAAVLFIYLNNTCTHTDYTSHNVLIHSFLYFCFSSHELFFLHFCFSSRQLLLVAGVCVCACLVSCVCVCVVLFCPWSLAHIDGASKHQCKARGGVWGLDCSRCPSVMSSPYRLHSLHVKHLPKSSELSFDTVTSKSQLGHYKLSSTWVWNRWALHQLILQAVSRLKLTYKGVFRL